MTADASAIDQVRLNVFGVLRVEARAHGEIELKSRRARALVAYLLLARGRQAPRERLASLLWSDRAEEQARASLRQCLLELRNSFKPLGLELIDAGRDLVSLRSGLIAGDLQAVEAAIAEKAPELLAEALRVIGSDPLLDGLSVPGLFEDWLDQARANLEERLCRAVHEALDKLEARGDWPGVRELAEAFLKRNPLDETVVAAAMRADVALGSSASAHRRYKVLKEGLARDLGVEPSAEARQALAGARSGAAAAEPPPRPFERTPEPQLSPHDLAAATETRPVVVVADFEAADMDQRTVLAVRSIREEVVSGLSRFRDLCIFSEPFSLSPPTVDSWSDTGAGYALSARLRPALGGARLAVQLLRIHDRRVVWSDVLDLPDSGLATAVDSIIARVTGAVLPSIDLDLVRLPARDAYARYISIREAADTARDIQAARKAAADLQALVEEAPDFVLPYPLLGRLYNTDFGYTQALSSGPQEFERAFELAKAALRLDRGHVHGYILAGWCFLRRHDWPVAKANFEQALNLNPFHAERVMEAGFGLLCLGELDRARSLLDRCMVLNPVPKDDFFMDLGLLEFLAGDYDRAASYLSLVARPLTWSTIYAGVNAALRGQDVQRAGEAARARIAAIWPPDKRMDVNDVLDWLALHLPLQVPELHSRFQDGARRMLEA